MTSIPSYVIFMAGVCAGTLISLIVTKLAQWQNQRDAQRRGGERG